jgi:hypothetical protein
MRTSSGREWHGLRPAIPCALTFASLKMNRFISCVIFGTVLMGCSSIPYQRLFSGSIRYQLSDEIEIIDIETNYPDRESVVTMGFKAGLKDGMTDSFTLVHFDRGYEVNERFYVIGYQWGRHLGSERRSQNLPSIVSDTVFTTEWKLDYY